jgi:AcrR family transcriptional regulator
MMDAVIDLVAAGNPAPTARQVAEQSGVALRTLFNRFRSVDDLFTSATDRQVALYRSLVTIIPPHGPLDLRIRVIANQRRQLFEAVGPMLRASYARLPASTDLTDVLAHLRRLLHQQLARTLEPEIDALGPQASVVLDTLDVITGWQNWSSLRVESGHSASKAEQIIVFTVAQVLG